MIIGVMSAEPHDSAKVHALATMGCTFVIIIANFDKFAGTWRESVASLRNHGIKVFITWPQYDATLLSDIHEGHRGFKEPGGLTNTQDSFRNAGGQVLQVSHWDNEAEQIIGRDITRWVETGIPFDGVHVTVATCDRMFPTNWWPFGRPDLAEVFWSFDDNAVAAWAEYSGNAPMPTHPVPGGGAEMDRFYTWYQNAYINRLTYLSNVVLDRGINQLSTWFLPHNRFTAQNMAGGTAGSVDPLDGWYRWIVARTSGVKPVMIVANHFPLRDDWPGWFDDGKETIERVCAPPYNWDLIIGADLAHENFMVARNIRGHGRQTAEMGGAGLFMADSLWLGLEEWEPGAIEAANETAKLFE